MSWLLLACGIALEVAGTICMKASDGFRHWRTGMLMYVLYGLSLTMLTFAFKRLDVSVAYALWSGAGVVLIASAGILWFREPASIARVLFITLILVGMVGLYLASPQSPDASRQTPDISCQSSDAGC